MNEDNILPYLGLIISVFSIVGNSYCIYKTFNSIDFIGGLCLWCFELVLFVMIVFFIKMIKDL